MTDQSTGSEVSAWCVAVLVSGTGVGLPAPCRAGETPALVPPESVREQRVREQSVRERRLWDSLVGASESLTMRDIYSTVLKKWNAALHTHSQSGHYRQVRNCFSVFHTLIAVLFKL